MCYFSKKQIWRRFPQSRGRNFISSETEPRRFSQESTFSEGSENQDEQISTSIRPTTKSGCQTSRRAIFKEKAFTVSCTPRRVCFGEGVRVILIPSIKDLEVELPGSINEMWWSREDYKKFTLFALDHLKKFRSLSARDEDESSCNFLSVGDCSRNTCSEEQVAIAA